jgi:hypothetical protein
MDDIEYGMDADWQAQLDLSLRKFNYRIYGSSSS